MAEVIIKLTDAGENMDIEVHSTDMTDEKSASNAVAEFLGASWDSVMQGAKMYAEAVRQAREAKKLADAGIIADEDTPVQILASQPKILKADGTGVHEATDA